GSPGKQPISISFKLISSLLTSRITAFCPGRNSDNFCGIVNDSGKANMVFSALFTNFEIMGFASKSKIYFFQEVPVSLRNRNLLKQAITKLVKQSGRELESLNFVFCNDERVLDINKQFLQHDYYTDIISFELSRKSEPLQGEIYISVD